MSFFDKVFSRNRILQNQWWNLKRIIWKDEAFTVGKGKIQFLFLVDFSKKNLNGKHFFYFFFLLMSAHVLLISLEISFLSFQIYILFAHILRFETLLVNVLCVRFTTSFTETLRITNFPHKFFPRTSHSILISLSLSLSLSPRRRKKKEEKFSVIFNHQGCVFDSVSIEFSGVWSH